MNRCKTRKRLCRMSVLVLSLLMISAVQGGVDGIYVVKAGHIVTVTRGVIENGMIVIRDGIIQAVGRDIDIPPGAEIITEDTMYVYPGLIDAHGSYALSEPEDKETTSSSGRSSRRPTAKPSPLLCPEQLMADMLNPEDGKITKMRETGVTTALTSLDRGVFIGQGCMINLSGERPEQMILKSPVALHVGYTNQPGTYPSTLMGVIAFQRQAFLDAQHHRLLWDRYQKQKRGWKRPEPNPSLDALGPVLDGRMPVVIAAEKENEIKRAKLLTDEFQLNAILSGVTEGWRVVDLLKRWGKPVLISMNYPEPEKVTGYAFKLEVEGLKIRKKQNEAEGQQKNDKKTGDGKTSTKQAKKQKKPELAEIYANASILHTAGVRFAFSSFGMKKPEELVKNAAKAVEHGLPADAALKAMTIVPAEIFDVADQVGSIEEGKIANLIVTTGPLFGEKTAVKYVFVDGEKFLIAKPKKKKGDAKVDVTGSWSVTVKTSMGEFAATLVLKQSEFEVSGEYQSEMGNASILDGSVSGQEIVFAIRLPVMGREMEMLFTGTVQEDTMEGSIGLGDMGSAEWEAEKSGPGR